MELKIGERGEKILQLLMLGILMLSMFVISKEGALFIHTSSTQVVAEKKKVIVIDAGHGGIHQNSYSEEYVKGGQVFYYGTSEVSKDLAETIQKQLKQLDPENKREAKANTSYYLLKKTSRPIVIVECGFLSNAAEADKLSDPLYEERLAFRIFMGIVQHIRDTY